jgi:hypothetical protein
MLGERCHWGPLQGAQQAQRLRVPTLLPANPLLLNGAKRCFKVLDGMGVRVTDSTGCVAEMKR